MLERRQAVNSLLKMMLTMFTVVERLVWALQGVQSEGEHNCKWIVRSVYCLAGE